MPLDMPGQNLPDTPALSVTRIERPEAAKLVDFIANHMRSGIATRSMNHEDLGAVETICYMIQDEGGDYAVQALAIVVTPEIEAQLHVVAE